jgi:hypothetical protein
MGSRTTAAGGPGEGAGGGGGQGGFGVAGADGLLSASSLMILYSDCDCGSNVIDTGAAWAAEPAAAAAALPTEPAYVQPSFCLLLNPRLLTPIHPF